MTQTKITELFDVERPAITKHLKNIFSDGKLEENSVCSKMEHTAADGKNYKTAFYNLDAIIAVGYRVNSKHDHSVPHLKLSENAVIKKYLITASNQTSTNL